MGIMAGQMKANAQRIGIMGDTSKGAAALTAWGFYMVGSLIQGCRLIDGPIAINKEVIAIHVAITAGAIDKADQIMDRRPLCRRRMVNDQCLRPPLPLNNNTTISKTSLPL